MKRFISLVLLICIVVSFASFAFADTKQVENIFVTLSGEIYEIPNSGISLLWMDCDGLGHRHGSSTYYQHGKTVVNGEWVPATGIYCAWCDGLMDVVVGSWL